MNSTDLKRCHDMSFCMENCSYRKLDFPECIIAMRDDTLPYIQHLEADNAELLTKVERLQAERDALISDFDEYDELPCALCKHYSQKESELPCKFCKNLATPTDEDKVSQWEWRGVQKEE